MHSWRSTLALACLCLALGASPADWMVRLKAFLTAVWENEAGIIDPLGTPRTDDAGQIDPWGAPSTDDAGHIDPLGGSGH